MTHLPFEMPHTWNLHATIAYIRTWSGLLGYEKARGPAATHRFFDDLASAWGPPETLRPIHWPLDLLLGRV